jgi:hypothetical protein
MGSHQEAAAAIEGLDDRFQWAGMTGPMVVELMDSNLQRQRRWAGLAMIALAMVVPVDSGAGPGDEE